MDPSIVDQAMRRFESGHPMSQDHGTPATPNQGRPRTAADASRLQGAGNNPNMRDLNMRWFMAQVDSRYAISARELHELHEAQETENNEVEAAQIGYDPTLLLGNEMKVPRFTAHLDPNFRVTQMSHLHQLAMSEGRAKIAAMNHDVVSAGLWALSGFDPALVHLAELRERFANLGEDDPIRITLDRLTAVYLEGQCRELIGGAGITIDQLDTQVQLLSDHRADDVATYIVDCTEEPLALEVMTYALYLGTLTAHGRAPWRRFSKVMAECYARRSMAR